MMQFIVGSLLEDVGDLGVAVFGCLLAIEDILNVGQRFGI